jgi:hypothetical protein
VSDGRESFLSYLGSLELAEEIRDLAVRHWDRCQQLSPEPIEIGFLSEPEPEFDSSFAYQALWLFSQNLGYEVWEFYADEEVDMASPGQSLTRLKIKPLNYELDEAPGPDARLSVTVFIGYGHDRGGVSGTLRASGANCLQLRTVLRDYLGPALPVRTSILRPAPG